MARAPEPAAGQPPSGGGAPGPEGPAPDSGSGLQPDSRRAPVNFRAGQTEPVGEIIRRVGQVAWAVVGIAAALAVVVYVASRISVIFPPLVLAGAIVFILNPFVSLLQRKGIPRVAGTGLAYLMFMGFMTLVVILAVPAIQDQARDFADHWPEVQRRVEHWIDARAEDLRGTPFEFDRRELARSFESEGVDVQEWVGRITDIGFRVLELLLIVIIAPIVAFYLLVDLPRLRRVGQSLVPEAAREDVLLVARRINDALGGFFRGQLVVAFIVGVLSSIGLRIVGLPFWLVVGAVAGFTNLIPLIGPWVGGALAVFIALTTSDIPTAIGSAVALLVVQQIDNHFISPLVMSRAVKLHPVVVMLVLLLGGSLFGFFGLFVAVPVTAVLKIVASHLWRVRVLGQTPEEWFEESESGEVPAVDGSEPPAEGSRWRLRWRRRAQLADRDAGSLSEQGR